MIHRLPPTMMQSRTAVKAIASRFSRGVVVKLRCRKKRRWTRICSTAATAMTYMMREGGKAWVATR